MFKYLWLRRLAKKDVADVRRKAQEENTEQHKKLDKGFEVLEAMMNETLVQLQEGTPPLIEDKSKKVKDK